MELQWIGMIALAQRPYMSRSDVLVQEILGRKSAPTSCQVAFNFRRWLDTFLFFLVLHPGALLLASLLLLIFSFLTMHD